MEQFAKPDFVAQSEEERLELENLTPLHFIANIIHCSKSREEGYNVPIHWALVSEKLKEEYLQNAMQLFDAWKKEEIFQGRQRGKMKEIIESNTIILSK